MLLGRVSARSGSDGINHTTRRLSERPDQTFPYIRSR